MCKEGALLPPRKGVSGALSCLNFQLRKAKGLWGQGPKYCAKVSSNLQKDISFHVKLMCLLALLPQCWLGLLRLTWEHGA